MDKQFGMVDVLALAVALAAAIFFIEGFIYGGIQQTKTSGPVYECGSPHGVQRMVLCNGVQV